MKRNQFSKDPKVKLISIDEFLFNNNFLIDAKDNLLNDNERPLYLHRYFKITEKYLTAIDYTLTRINYGMDKSEKLETIYVAKRDGLTEYKLFDEQILILKEMTEKINEDKQKKQINNQIEQLLSAKKLLPIYKDSLTTIPGKFSSFLIDVNYKTEIECFKNNYVVLDIETNGLRKATDDLLSISIYDPTTGICYNRFLPLDLQPVVLTGWINGITEEMLKTATHISQEEFDQIIDYFKLNEKIILSYSGGQGSFDSSFLEQYCKRHNLIGYEKFKYENIKSILPFPGFGYEGLLSKDNLCRLFNIIIDNKIHSSMNDCLLEWQLFEKIKNQPLFFANQYLMRFNKGYIVPVSYLNRFPELAKYANITIPHIESKTELIFSHVLPRNILKLVKKFPTNITGIALEHGLYSKLQVEKQDNSLFLLKNKQYLENLGTLENRLIQIPVVIKTDGSIQSLDKKNEDFIKEINYVTKLITENMQPIFNYIKNEIFHNEKILSQELSISNDNKVLAICDLSSKTKIMEIKTFNAIQNGKLLKKVATQLFYESKGRRKFLLTIDFKEKNERLKKVLSKVCINIYEVEQVISDPIPEIFTYQLSIYDLMILKLIKNNPCITNTEIAHRISISSQGVSTILKRLKEFGYISNIDEFGKKTPWSILRDSSDNKTQFTLDQGKRIIYKS